jgi:hypothetical protein
MWKEMAGVIFARLQVASTIRAHFPALGLVQPSAVVSMRRK